MDLLRNLSEGLARKTTRRGLFGRSAGLATGALMGVAAGTLTRQHPVIAGGGTVCSFPGPPCPCDECTETRPCAKPCVFNTTWYPSGCWVTRGVTCCDCTCQDVGGLGWCGCGSDYHNNPAYCP